MLGLVARSITTKSSFLQRGAGGRGGGVFVVAAGRSGGSCITTGSQHQHQQQGQPYLQYEQRHSYVSRAHPRRLPEYPIGAALQMVLEETQERYAERAAKWERNAPVRMSKGKQDSGPYRNMDETIELAINLNVDPRRPGQALRGSLRLPHGTGKSVKCLVFTSDPDLIAKATSQGQNHLAGGDDLLQQISSGQVPLEQYSRALATQEWISPIQKSLARVLGPRGLMPNAKTNTVFESAEDLWETLQEQSNTITYRTDANGVLQFPIGKASFEMNQLLENLEAVCQTVQDIKPEQYGKGKKKKSSGKGGGGGSKVGKNVKYWMRASLSSTQGKGVRMDLRTVDPTSPFFMKEPE